jgi:hypothetical protein
MLKNLKEKSKSDKVLNRTFELKTFARKLGFENAQDKTFRRLLKRWILEGSVAVYQGGYKGHSLAHPKKVKLMKTLEYFTQKRTKPKLNFYQVKMVLNEFGFKLTHALKDFECSCCHAKVKGKPLDYWSEYKTVYAQKRIFLNIKLCEECIFKILEGQKLLVEVKIGEGHVKGRSL